MARSKFTLRRPVPLVLVAAIASYVIVPQMIRARAEARFSQCQNHFFQHSGSHLSDIVYLNRKLDVIGVSSCPLCNHPAAQLTYVISESNKPWIQVGEDALPRSSIESGKLQLYSFKAGPRYHAQRQRFSAPDYVALRDRLFEDLERAQAVTESDQVN